MQLYHIMMLSILLLVARGGVQPPCTAGGLEGSQKTRGICAAESVFPLPWVMPLCDKSCAGVCESCNMCGMVGLAHRRAPTVLGALLMF